MSATTTATFAAMGIDSTLFTNFLNTIFGQALDFFIYIVQLLWPFWLGLGLLGAIIGVAMAILHFRKH